MKKIMVIKYGGSILHDKDKQKKFFQDISRLHHEGISIVLVHGGGNEISFYSQKLGINPVFKEGRRVTDADTLEIAQMVLCGKINRELVCALNQFDIKAVGLSGQDASMIQVKAKDKAFGFVGEIKACSTSLLTFLLENNYLPVIAPIAVDQLGQSYNVNADEIAASIATSLHADDLIFMTDVEGVYLDIDDVTSLIVDLSIEQLKNLLADKKISDGMIPKLEASLFAVEQGVKKVFVGSTMITCRPGKREAFIRDPDAILDISLDPGSRYRLAGTTEI